MPRVKFINGTQSDFILEVRSKSGRSWVELAKIAQCHRRSFSDWKNMTYLMPASAYVRLQSMFKLPGYKVTYLSDKWHIQRAARLGGQRRVELFGNPGTPEGRSMGGKRTWQRLRANPELAKRSKLIQRVQILKPPYGNDLAEFVGICLGDGHITSRQLLVYLNARDDYHYVIYVSQLIRKLFGLRVSLSRKTGVIVVYISSASVCEFMKHRGLHWGNKVRQQVNVPHWIQKDLEYANACLRALIDTDGCYYVDHHLINGRDYFHQGLNFTNRSIPLLDFVSSTMVRNGLRPTQNTKYSVVLRIGVDIDKYMRSIGTSNAKIWRKYAKYKCDGERYGSG